MFQLYAEFANRPPQHSVEHLPGGQLRVTFYEEITNLEAIAPEDPAGAPGPERWRAACYPLMVPDQPGIEARIEANESAWRARAVGEASQKEAERVRRGRDARLAQCDYTMGADYPATDAEREAWRAYRQALRDIPEQEGFPWGVTWPEAPKREKGGETLLGAIEELKGGGEA